MKTKTVVALFAVAVVALAAAQAPLRNNFSLFAATPCRWVISVSLDHEAY